MVVNKCPIEGVWQISPEPIEDQRGCFARTVCIEELATYGIKAHFAQCSFSLNHLAGTLRGMHFQKEPFGEHKLIRCTRGAIFDVVVDLRPESSTHKRWYGVELTEQNHMAIYLSPGIAHGYITLCDATEVLYMMVEPYKPGASSGVNWQDPAFGIDWPILPVCISAKDANYPPYEL